METPNRAMIVGAGVGGLSAAVALRRAGMDAVIFERAPRLIDVGCVQLWSNGVVALDELGLADELYRRGIEMHTQEFRTSGGKVLFAAAVADIARKHGTLPPANIKRVDLIELVFEAIEDGVVQFGCACTDFEQDADGVTVRLADGREERGSVLIAADGITSSIRQKLFGVQPRYAHAEVMRGVIPFEHPLIPAGKFSLTFGRGDRFGMIHTSPDTLCWFGIVMKDEPTQQGEAERSGDARGSDGRKQLLLDRYGDFPPPTREVIEATPEETIYRADIRDIVPLERWTAGRVTLLGDAAHAATPYLGRGAGEAIEDSLKLTERLQAAGGLDGRVETALEEYEAARRPSTTRTQTTAWRFGRFAGLRSPVAFRIRRVMMSTVGKRAVTRAIHTEFGELGKRARDAANAAAED